MYPNDEVDDDNIDAVMKKALADAPDYKEDVDASPDSDSEEDDVHVNHAPLLKDTPAPVRGSVAWRDAIDGISNDTKFDDVLTVLGLQELNLLREIVADHSTIAMGKIYIMTNGRQYKCQCRAPGHVRRECALFMPLVGSEECTFSLMVRWLVSGQGKSGDDHLSARDYMKHAYGLRR